MPQVDFLDALVAATTVETEEEAAAVELVAQRSKARSTRPDQCWLGWMIRGVASRRTLSRSIVVSISGGIAASGSKRVDRGYAAAVATKTTEELIADAKAWWTEVTVTTKPKGTGEITPLPGLRRPTESEREAT